MLLARVGAPLTAENERAAVYLTNALTGWQPPQGPKQQLTLPELEAERDAAEHVKREVPILVIIGNPPYNAFAGTSPAEEEGLVEPYKEGLQGDWGIRKFNLDELYVRFLRVAERRIVEGTGRGIVCFISSYSYLSDPSFVVVRRHLLDGFDSIWIDSLNGDSRETGKRTPSGEPDPSVFSTDLNPAGIRLGTTVGLFVRRNPASSRSGAVAYRQFWGRDKREELLSTLHDPHSEASYELASPTVANRFNFRPQAASPDYAEWPNLRELAETEPFSGFQEMRKGTLISLDQPSLERRLRRYLDPTLSFETVRREGMGPIDSAGRFNPESARQRMLSRETFDPSHVVRYGLLPLDNRFAYHTTVRPIWNEPRPEFAAQVREGNLFIVSRMMAERPQEGIPIIGTRTLADYHLLRPNIQAIPVRLFSSDRPQSDMLANEPASRANLSPSARAWLTSIGWPDPDISIELGAAPWLHVLAICCSPAWLCENRTAVLGGWPRVPLPASAETLRDSANLGSRVADLLDPDRPVSGVTTATPVSPFGIFGVITRAGGGMLDASDLTVTVGWGYGGNGRPVMPGQGRVIERSAYTPEEIVELERSADERGETFDALIRRLGPPIDVWLNGVAYWRTVPRSVWEFTIGGYQVFKKWLSYRERDVLGRPLTTTEAREATALVRRLAALVVMQPDLDSNYLAIRNTAFAWPRG